MEKTLVIIKPDAVKRNLIGEIISRFERKGLNILKMKINVIDSKQAHNHYGEHKGKPFFKGLVEFITSGPSVAMVVEGISAIKVVRMMVGATNPADANPGTIRGDYSVDINENLVHASDSLESSSKEISIFFGNDL